MATSTSNRPDRGGVRSRMHMRMRTVALGVLAVVLPTSYASGRSMRRVGFRGSSPAFDLAGRPVGGARPASPTPAHLTGSRIMAAGDGALVIDGDSGVLIRADKDGKNIGQVAV